MFALLVSFFVLFCKHTKRVRLLLPLFCLCIIFVVFKRPNQFARVEVKIHSCLAIFDVFHHFLHDLVDIFFAQRQWHNFVASSHDVTCCIDRPPQVRHIFTRHFATFELSTQTLCNKKKLMRHILATTRHTNEKKLTKVSWHRRHTFKL